MPPLAQGQSPTTPPTPTTPNIYQITDQESAPPVDPENCGNPNQPTCEPFISKSALQLNVDAKHYMTISRSILLAITDNREDLEAAIEQFRIKISEDASPMVLATYGDEIEQVIRRGASASAWEKVDDSVDVAYPYRNRFAYGHCPGGSCVVDNKILILSDTDDILHWEIHSTRVIGADGKAGTDTVIFNHAGVGTGGWNILLSPEQKEFYLELFAPTKGPVYAFNYNKYVRDVLYSGVLPISFDGDKVTNFEKAIMRMRGKINYPDEGGLVIQEEGDFELGRQVASDGTVSYTGTLDIYGGMTYILVSGSIKAQTITMHAELAPGNSCALPNKCKPTTFIIGGTVNTGITGNATREQTIEIRDGYSIAGDVDFVANNAATLKDILRINPRTVDATLTFDDAFSLKFHNYDRLEKIGAGTLVLNSSYSFTENGVSLDLGEGRLLVREGITLAGQGDLPMGADTTLEILGTLGMDVVGNDGSQTVVLSDIQSLARTIMLKGGRDTLELRLSGSLSFTATTLATISGIDVLVKAGTATWTVSTDLTPSYEEFVFKAGTITGEGSLTFPDGHVLVWAGGSLSIPISVADGSKISSIAFGPASGTTLTVSGADLSYLRGYDQILKQGEGTLKQTGEFDISGYSGGILLQAGTWELADGAVLKVPSLTFAEGAGGLTSTTSGANAGYLQLVGDSDKDIEVTWEEGGISVKVVGRVAGRDTLAMAPLEGITLNFNADLWVDFDGFSKSGAGTVIQSGNFDLGSSVFSIGAGGYELAASATLDAGRIDLADGTSLVIKGTVNAPIKTASGGQVITLYSTAKTTAGMDLTASTEELHIVLTNSADTLTLSSTSFGQWQGVDQVFLSGSGSLSIGTGYTLTTELLDLGAATLTGMGTVVIAGDTGHLVWRNNTIGANITLVASGSNNVLEINPNTDTNFDTAYATLLTRFTAFEHFRKDGSAKLVQSVDWQRSQLEIRQGGWSINNGVTLTVNQLGLFNPTGIEGTGTVAISNERLF